jgi:hypothetical protein
MKHVLNAATKPSTISCLGKRTKKSIVAARQKSEQFWRQLGSLLNAVFLNQPEKTD